MTIGGGPVILILVRNEGGGVGVGGTIGHLSRRGHPELCQGGGGVLAVTLFVEFSETG